MWFFSMSLRMFYTNHFVNRNVNMTKGKFVEIKLHKLLRTQKNKWYHPWKKHLPVLHHNVVKIGY